MAVFVDQNAVKDLECAICLDLFKEPVQIGCQDHIFCKACAIGLITQPNNSLNCPICRVPSQADDIQRVRWIDRTINCLVVRCPNYEITSEKLQYFRNKHVEQQRQQNNYNINNSDTDTGPLRRSKRLQEKEEKEENEKEKEQEEQQNDHEEKSTESDDSDLILLTENPTNNNNKNISVSGQKRRRNSSNNNYNNDNIPVTKRLKLNDEELCAWSGVYSDFKNHISNCSLQLITCKYCLGSMLRRDLQQHYEWCPMLPITCLQCNQEEILRTHMSSHIQWECPTTVIYCVQKCGEKIQRQYQQCHIKNQCCETFVRCQFYEFGCLEPIKRGYQQIHFHNAAVMHNHLLNVASHHKRLDNEIQQLQAANSNLNQRMCTLEQEHKKQILKLTQEIVAMKSTQKKKTQVKHFSRR